MRFSAMIPILIVCQAAAPAVAALPAAMLHARWDAFFQTLVDDGRINGNVLVAESGRPIYQRSFGFADAAKRIPNSASTPFVLASISKR